MRWLFSNSGNSSVDYDAETADSLQPLSWDADDIACAKEIITEADTIMSDALAGLAFLSERPDLLEHVQQNVKRVYKAIARQKGKRHEPKVRLKWPYDVLTDSHG